MVSVYPTGRQHIDQYVSTWNGLPVQIGAQNPAAPVIKPTLPSISMLLYPLICDKGEMQAAFLFSHCLGNNIYQSVVDSFFGNSDRIINRFGV